MKIKKKFKKCLQKKFEDFKPTKKYPKQQEHTVKRLQKRQWLDLKEDIKSCDTSLISEASSFSNWSENVPYEILFKIFYYYSHTIDGDIRKLNNLKIVSKQWNYVASDERLMHSLNISKFNYKTSIKRLLNQKSNFNYLANLNLSDLKDFTCDNLSAILSKCNPNQMRELKLANCEKINVSKMNLNYMKLISDYCPRLSSLDLAGMKKTLKQNDAQYLFKNLNLNLKRINLAQNLITPSLLYCLSENCRNLETIDISNCDPLSPILKSKFNLDIFMKNCPKIKHFRMLNCSITTNYDNIFKVYASDADFLNLTEFSSGLGLIHPFYTEHISTNSLLFMMAKVCKDASNLKSLDLRAYKSPLNSQLNLFDIIKSNVLEKLFLCNANFSEADNFYLYQAISTKWFASLVVLDLSWCNISNEYLNKILKKFTQNSHQVKVNTLTLTGTCVETDMIKELVNNVKSLEYIDLSSCRSVERGMKKKNTIVELKHFLKIYK